MSEHASCDCAKCKAMCMNPGWFSPEDAKAAMDAGYAKTMMLDWLTPSTKLGNDDEILVLAAASRGYEGDWAPDSPDLFAWFAGWTKGRCTHQGKDGLCDLHATVFKPLQCRANTGCKDDGFSLDNYAMARMWQGEDAQALVKEWAGMVGLDTSYR